jgi:hypothetical protein
MMTSKCSSAYTAASHAASALEANMNMSREKERRAQSQDANDDIADDWPKPGCGLSTRGAKFPYIRVGSRGVYDNTRKFHRPDLFYSQTGFTVQEFDALFVTLKDELAKPLNQLCSEQGRKTQRFKQHEPSTLPSLFFLFFK